jgi:hypothetical protein
MIRQETAARIWNCYREIEAGEKLLADMAEVEKRYRADKTAPTLKDAFGERRHLQLGIPSGDACHRLLDVHPDLAKSCIRSHIATKRAQLVEANEQARVELDTVSVFEKTPAAGDEIDDSTDVDGEEDDA